MLPPDQQAALVLVDMLGYTVADAAEVLGVSVGTVKSRCSRGRARLLPLLVEHRTPGAGSSHPEPPGNPRVAPRVGPTQTRAADQEVRDSDT
jgi:RNA polymerase sigma-70 factor, ECF subfamily